ncbi:MAG: hypothetical protein P8104_02960 [Gammaproteobacteria bacterium]
MKSKKIRTTICLPISMLNQIHKSIEEEGNSRKRRSQWIEMTILRLLDQSHYEGLIMEEFLEPGLNTTIPLSLSETTKSKIDQTLDQIKKKTHQQFEISAFIRTAISQYLIQRASLGGKMNGIQ